MKTLKSIFLTLLLAFAIPAFAKTDTKTDNTANVNHITKPMFAKTQEWEGFDYTYMSPYMLNMLNSSENNGTFQGFPISRLKMVEMVKTQFKGKKEGINNLIDRLTKRQVVDIIPLAGNKEIEISKAIDTSKPNKTMVPLSIKQGDNKSIELYIDPVDNSENRIQRLLIIKRENFNQTLTIIYLICDLSLNEIQSLVR